MMKKTIIIAEAGVNHNGSIELALKLVDKAADAGADYIKFQTFKAENLVNKSAQQAEYQKRNIGLEENQLEMLKRLELTFEDFRVIEAYCKERNIRFLSTPFDIKSIDFLTSLNLDYMKVPSGEITNLPYLKKIAQTGIPIILSTGMCRLGDVEAALDVLYSQGANIDNITLLHCNTEYPTPMADVNLKAIDTLRLAFGTKVGYSDHTKGIEIPIAAVAIGATIIEKHFTLDRTLPGPDHVASLEPLELKAMVNAIRNVEAAMGTPLKRVTPSEKKNITVARKSIVAKVPIKTGEVFSEYNLTAKRPGTGISPMRWDEIIGRQASTNFKTDEQIKI